MLTSLRHLFFILITGILLGSCGKEEIQFPWVIRYTSPGYTLTSLRSAGGSRLITTGGDTWYKGIFAESLDGGESWTGDSLGNKQLFGIGGKDSISVTVGIDGYVYEKTGDSAWVFHRLSHWDILRDIEVLSPGDWVAVGGVAFKEGVIYRIRDRQVVSVTEYPHELQWIEQAGDGSLFAGGYGLVVKSLDRGETWKALELSGDFFQDACFLRNGTGYMVGYAGGIWKTSDHGQHWKKIQRPGRLSRLPGLRAIEFQDESTGIVAGDAGLIWFSTDGGANWQEIEGTPGSTDWYDALIQDNKAWLCGSGASILELDLK